VESGIYEGFEVPIYYDPLIAKLLVWAPTRREAIERMKRALKEYTIRGIKTSIPFHLLVMENPQFIAGDYDTTFIDRILGKIEYKKENHQIAAIVAMVTKLLQEQKTTISQTKSTSTGMSPWKLSARQSMLRKF
jgi:acetyl-CoA carboxylase biotin carboxylase subunit